MHTCRHNARTQMSQAYKMPFVHIKRVVPAHTMAPSERIKPHYSCIARASTWQHSLAAYRSEYVLHFMLCFISSFLLGAFRFDTSPSATYDTQFL